MRNNGRKNNELRPITITRNYLKHPEGSVLIELGDTKVLCNATIEDKVPGWMKEPGRGWITAEYSLLPRSTVVRTRREALSGKVSGRTAEIMRLIGRSLRSVVDLDLLGERTIIIDCDVIQADGGTRTASITGAFVAMVDAINSLNARGLRKEYPVKAYLSAVSVGIGQGDVILDLDYDEDSQAQVDMNLVMTSGGDIVEIQGTAEGNPFSPDQLNGMLNVGRQGIARLVEAQRSALEDVTGIILPDRVMI